MTNGFDKQLRDSLIASSAADDASECLDAALGAAWFDGTLSQAERVKVEAHAASCSRCQAMIAALVRTDRPSPRLWWRAPAVRWLVPAAVAATALLVLWSGELRPDRGGTEPGTIARGLDSPVPSAPPSEPVAREEARESSAVRPAAAADMAAPVPPAATAPRQETTARPQPLPEKTTDQRRSSPAPASERIEPSQVGFGAAAPLPQAPEMTAAKASPPPPASARVGAVSGPPPPSAPVRPDADQSADAARRLRDGGPAESLLLRAGRGGRAAVIQSLDPSVQWRIAGAGQVERSENGGVTWQTQATGVSAALTAGAAPSANICWLVGARGVVLKTVDGGRTWRRVAFPEEVDLLGVVADDDRAATITAAAGRKFHTTDGGETWK